MANASSLVFLCIFFNHKKFITDFEMGAIRAYKEIWVEQLKQMKC